MDKERIFKGIPGTVIRAAKRFSDLEDAESVAEQLKAGDPDWNYDVEVFLGDFVVVVFDEDNEFVGVWGEDDPKPVDKPKTKLDELGGTSYLS